MQSIDNILNSKKTVITPSESSEAMGVNPYSINIMAKENKLPFPHFMIGNRVKIPRIPFLNYLGYKEAAHDQQ